MTVDDFYCDSEIASALGKYLDAKDVKARFDKSISDLSSKECLIPVLGTQGSGKSSFLDAVLFGDIVLPVDADETTCIPTVVKYGENTEPSACVVMADGTRKKVDCSEAGLADYVHQEKNPGNEKGVSCIEIVIKNELLKNGIVFVDLPGVGSITAANQNTTIEYLKNCTAAIFMLRTCPPITESESVFIMGALPLMGRVFWVQNQWIDESKADVEEGRQENSFRLHDIAKKIKYPASSIYDPDVVCVKRALDGRIKDDVRQVASSGIEAFRDKVIHFAADWRKDVLQGKREQARELLAAAVKAAQTKVEQLSGNVQEERDKIVEERQSVDAALEENRRIGREARDYLLDRKATINSLIDGECQKCVENLRNGIREAIDAGLVGGDQLNKAFNDYKNRGNEDVFNVVQPAFIEMTAQLGQMLDGLQDCSGVVPSLLQPKHPKSTAFSDKTKIHAFYELGGSIAGGVGGYFGGGAAVVALGSGPVGWIVGGGILIGSLLLGNFCGAKAREAHVNSQKEIARSELFKAAEQFAAKLRTGYKQSYEQFAESLDRAIRDWMRTQQNVADARYRKALSDLERPIADKNAAICEAKKDIAAFKKMLSEFGGK